MSGLADSDPLRYYDSGLEASRLSTIVGRLEAERSKILLERYLPPTPAVVYDIGGGPGYYAVWLTRRGYAVHLFDPVELHIEQARALSSKGDATALAGAVVADARKIPRPDASADAVLLMGPLYHLTERTNRLIALKEARRLLDESGTMIGVAISRWASALDGLARNLLLDPEFSKIVAEDLETGQHRNEAHHPDYFTTAFFHDPAGLIDEVTEAGFSVDAVLGIEGPSWLFADLEERWADAAKRKAVLESAARLEKEPSLLGTSAHIMIVARKG